ncbi:hypothetical protein [Flagellimonas iocasae]|uniref:Uncharacterized protein n=1 Tax=Flagellimonas iocasae TaxID=2055905 RepID=A0ABW4Y2F0_9FLAO
MNQRTKEFIVAVQNHDTIYGETSITAFVEGMKAIEQGFYTRQTLADKLERGNFTYFVNKSGVVYEIYRYKNPNYKPQGKSDDDQ